MSGKIRAGFAFGVGVSMISLWTMLLFAGQVPELATHPYSIAFHLAAELLTAVFLILGALVYFRNPPLGEKICLIAFGMLLYTVINSSGYYAQSGDWSFVAMFALLFIFTVFFLVRLLFGGKGA